MKINIKKVARKKKQWSLYKLSQELGIPQQTVYSWANGRTQPSYQNMDRLCDALECSIDELYTPEKPGYTIKRTISIVKEKIAK
jgi:transcriptional regulator with XRE-family HTH domain